MVVPVGAATAVAVATVAAAVGTTTGRGADDAAVDAWLRAARGVSGYHGFAIGRSIWWSPLKFFVDGAVPRDETVAQIANNYRRFVAVYEEG